jgi:hypothetical protein
MAHRWWELHNPHPQPLAVHDDGRRCDKRGQHVAKQYQDDTSTHTRVHTLAPALLPRDDA